jgi:hypothetical protein
MGLRKRRTMQSQLGGGGRAADLTSCPGADEIYTCTLSGLHLMLFLSPHLR